MKQEKAIAAFMHVFTICSLSNMRFNIKISVVNFHHGKFYSVILVLNTLPKNILEKKMAFRNSLYLSEETQYKNYVCFLCATTAALLFIFLVGSLADK